MFKLYKNGFTLIEVLIAIFLITTGVIGAFTLIQQVISSISVSSSKLTAAYLAQEGIEIVRNIRDTNWLEQREPPILEWDEGLDVGDWEADYETQNLTQPYTGDGDFLNIDANGFYSYSLGIPTKFKRKISIEKPNPDILRVSAQIQWEERGRTHTIEVRENFYKWH